jgi:RNA polymerase sigma-70 factor (ECF subfamily)
VPPGEITLLLHRWGAGDRVALDELTPLIYPELRRQARMCLRRERSGHTLASGALVNEAFLRIVDQRAAHLNDRDHFFSISSQIIRHILVDHARAKRRDKRGGGVAAVELKEAIAEPAHRERNLVALDDALNDLAKLDPLQSQVVELRFFGGFSIEETAQALGLSVTTVNRYWVTARAWLLRELQRNSA